MRSVARPTDSGVGITRILGPMSKGPHRKRRWVDGQQAQRANPEEKESRKMRKVVVVAFLSLDGVMQAPGGPDEDTSGGFRFGGWTVPHSDETLGEVMGDQMTKPADLLLGRKTFEIFASYWPDHAEGWPGINEMTKYVV